MLCFLQIHNAELAATFQQMNDSLQEICPTAEVVKKPLLSQVGSVVVSLTVDQLS